MFGDGDQAGMGIRKKSMGNNGRSLTLSGFREPGTSALFDAGGSVTMSGGIMM